MASSNKREILDGVLEIFERLSKYIGILSGIIAALTFASGNRILSYAFVIVGYTLISQFLWKVSHAKSIPEHSIVISRTERKSSYTYSPKQRYTAQVGLVGLTIFCFSWIGANSWNDWRSLQVCQTAKEGEFLVLISRYEKKGTKQDIEVAQYIYDALLREIDRTNLGDVRLELIRSVKDVSEAKTIAMSCKAAFIMWGWYDDIGLTPNFNVLRDVVVDTSALLPVPANPPQDYSLTVTRELPDHLTFLSETAIGQLYFSDKMFDKALNAFDAALSRVDANSPPNGVANIYFYRGNTQLYLGNVQSAIDDYTEVIRIVPDNGPAYTNRGFAFSIEQKWHQAINDLNKAITLQPENADALAYRGMAYFGLGSCQQAQQDFKQYLKLGKDEQLKEVAQSIIAIGC